MHAPATVADRSRAVLVVVDIQERLAAAMERREQVNARTSLLVRAARIVGVPVVVTRQYPRGLGDLEPAILEVLSEDDSWTEAMHDKMTFDCFGECGFSDAIRDSERDQVILAGMETHICVTQTALAALARGLEVHVAADACCSREQENHDIALARLAHAGAVVTSSESVAYELVGCAGTGEFKALLAAVKA